MDLSNDGYKDADLVPESSDECKISCRILDLPMLNLTDQASPVIDVIGKTVVHYTPQCIVLDDEAHQTSNLDASDTAEDSDCPSPSLLTGGITSHIEKHTDNLSQTQSTDTKKTEECGPTSLIPIVADDNNKRCTAAETIVTARNEDVLAQSMQTTSIDSSQDMFFSLSLKKTDCLVDTESPNVTWSAQDAAENLAHHVTDGIIAPALSSKTVTLAASSNVHQSPHSTLSSTDDSESVKSESSESLFSNDDTASLTLVCDDLLKKKYKKIKSEQNAIRRLVKSTSSSHDISDAQRRSESLERMLLEINDDNKLERNTLLVKVKLCRSRRERGSLRKLLSQLSSRQKNVLDMLREQVSIKRQVQWVMSHFRNIAKRENYTRTIKTSNTESNCSYNSYEMRDKRRGQRVTEKRKIKRNNSNRSGDGQATSKMTLHRGSSILEPDRQRSQNQWDARKLATQGYLAGSFTLPDTYSEQTHLSNNITEKATKKIEQANNRIEYDNKIVKSSYTNKTTCRSVGVSAKHEQTLKPITTEIPNENVGPNSIPSLLTQADDGVQNGDGVTRCQVISKQSKPIQNNSSQQPVYTEPITCLSEPLFNSQIVGSIDGVKDPDKSDMGSFSDLRDLFIRCKVRLIDATELIELHETLPRDLWEVPFSNIQISKELWNSVDKWG